MVQIICSLLIMFGLFGVAGALHKLIEKGVSVDITINPTILESEDRRDKRGWKVQVR